LCKGRKSKLKVDKKRHSQGHGGNRQRKQAPASHRIRSITASSSSLNDH
jgi:hypothetical protein